MAESTGNIFDDNAETASFWARYEFFFAILLFRTLKPELAMIIR